MGTHRRHDISDEVWKLIEPHLPGQVGQWGRVAGNNREFVNAVLWILRTGAPWRDLPPDYGKWNTQAKRYARWCKNGIWENMHSKLVKIPELKLLMVDGSHIKVHQHGTGARGGNQDMGRTKGGSIRRYTLRWMEEAFLSRLK